MSDLLKHLAKKIDVEMKAIEEDMAFGRAADFGAYKYACGIYRGLLVAKDIIIQTAERLEQDND